MTKYDMADPLNAAWRIPRLDEISALYDNEVGSMLANMDYSFFLRTPYWKSVALNVKMKSGHMCQLCGEKGNMHVHHRRYTNRGRDHLFMADLTCLCPRCHGAFHGVKTKKKKIWRP
jgi:hypothetical protein